MHFFETNVLIFMMSSICFEPEGSSSGRRTHSSTYKTTYTVACKTYYTIPTCTYNRLTEDEPSGSKHIEDVIKIKILV